MATTIEKAQAATLEIQDYLGKAANLLSCGLDDRSLNRSGVYKDHFLQRRTLRAAIEALTAAIEIASRTTWPSAADYETEKNKPHIAA